MNIKRTEKKGWGEILVLLLRVISLIVSWKGSSMAKRRFLKDPLLVFMPAS